MFAVAEKLIKVSKIAEIIILSLIANIMKPQKEVQNISRF